MILDRVRSTLRALVRRSTLEQDMDDEIALHLELRVEDLVRQGIPPADARRRARNEFGNVGTTKENARASLGLAWFDRVAQDLRYALRGLRLNLGFSTVALLSLGLGIGATTTVFSVIDAIDFRPLPFRDASRLVWLTELTPDGNEYCTHCPFATSAPTAIDWAAQASTIDTIAAFDSDDFSWEHDDVAETIPAARATANLLPLLGVHPFLGRSFVAEDALAGAEAVALVSYPFWRTRLGGDSSVVGSRLGSVRVIGVLPEEFRFTEDPEVWQPLRLDPSARRSNRVLRIVARLDEGQSIGAADAEIRLITSRLAAQYPEVYRGWDATALPVRDLFTMGAGSGRFILFAFTMLVLVIAVANVASLLLARSVAREPEFALRTALGASRSRLIVQMLVEGGIIGIGGGVIGVALARWAVRLAQDWLSMKGSGLAVTIDGRMLVFAAMVSIVSGIGAAMMPVLRIASADLGGRLREARGSRGRAASGLIAFQIATALVLLTAAALLSRDFLEMRYFDLGYNPRQLYSTAVGASGTKDPETWRRIAADVRTRIERIHGVRAASLEYRSAVHPTIVRASDNSSAHGGPGSPVLKSVDASFFRTMGTLLIAGRSFTSDDRPGAALVAIVNKAAANAFWPAQNPIGRHVYVGDTPSDGELLTVIGVADDAERGEMIKRHWATVYRPFAQAKLYHTIAALHVRVEPDAESAIAAAQTVMRQATGSAARPFASAAARLHDRLFAWQVNAIIFELFAGFGLLLAAMGIYGIVAYAVRRRTREIAIRVALGARQENVVMLVAKRGLLVAATGVCIGLAGALALTRVFRSMIVGTTPSPWIFASAAAIMITTALIAALVPARRAAGVDSVVALRAE